MAKEEACVPSKPEKASSPVQEQSNIHAYPNWAAVQAYYGPGVNLPPPYFNSAVASGHPPHPYMWGTPQHLMSPYGTPYAAIYPPGGVYAHPPFPGSSSQGLGNSLSPFASEAMAVTPLSTATPAKSSSDKDRTLMKKFKGLNGSAISIGNGNSGSSAASHSGDCGTEGSSAGSDENTREKGDNTQMKRTYESLQSTGKDVDVFTVYSGEINVFSNMALGVALASASVAGKSERTPPSSNGRAITAVATSAPALVSEVRSQDGIATGHLTKDERELKRERRKQSNRESARRSRLRKQAEAEELAVKVESLNAENMALRSEINQLTESSENLRLENASLMEKLNTTELDGAGGVVSNSMELHDEHPVSTENFLSRVENSLSNNGGAHREIESNEDPNSGTKLHQLLESSPRADVVTAS